MSNDLPSWYLSAGDKTHNGPFTAAQIIEAWQAGRLDPTLLCWREGMPKWLPLAQVEPFSRAIRKPGKVRSISWRSLPIAGAVAVIVVVVCLTLFWAASAVRSSKNVAGKLKNTSARPVDPNLSKGIWIGSTIVGKWKASSPMAFFGYENQVEFFRDGTFRVFRDGTAVAGLFRGTWEFLADGRLRLKWLGRMEVSEISFHKDAMDLKHPDGYIDSCERVSIPGAETGASPSLVRMKLPEITVDLGDDVKLDLVLIPAGSFMMGEERGNDDEKPVHRVAISQPFYLGKHEVTQEQWHAVMGSNPSRVKGPDYPVENVTWYDCQEFIKRLNEKHGGNRTEYRLPTEAEWEYACRAGSTGAWCFGEDPWQLGDFAWDCFNSYRHDASGGQPHAVGLKLSNAWGLYDMYGNVSEWCADWYDSRYYALSPANDPKGPSSNPMDPRYYGDRRVLRGGSWSGIPTSAARAAGDGRKVYTDRGEHGSDGENGFRVAGTK